MTEINNFCCSLDCEKYLQSTTAVLINVSTKNGYWIFKAKDCSAGRDGQNLKFSLRFFLRGQTHLNHIDIKPNCAEEIQRHGVTFSLLDDIEQSEDENTWGGWGCISTERAHILHEYLNIKKLRT